MVARRAIMVAAAVLCFGAPRPSAAVEPDSAPGAIGGTVGLATFATIVCWTAATLEKRNETTAEPDEAGEGSRTETQQARFDRRGWHVGVDGSFGIQNFREQEEADLQEALLPFETSLTLNSNSGGVGGRVGYRCTRHVAAEVQVSWLDAFDGELFETSQGKIATASYRPILTTVNAKGYLLTGRIQPYALVGAGALTVRSEIRESVSLAESEVSTNTVFALRLGWGVEFYATKHVVVNAGAAYVLPLTGIDTFKYYTIDGGIEYRF